ncbi:alpha-N-acetylgalactosaminidase-like isoform X2 [Pomacea canaliculata]|uniref:alpha-N-acetylgalactosaminidase-like isoform X2 n=1 Tax=Pomacea canaliculata TaxID=400727 RepID=UPI000D729F88|nr:alpha-N-acetylgalactosaminidase-like isoform X2 [Pomacea canaliculata]
MILGADMSTNFCSSVELLVLSSIVCVTLALENGLARTPPMGWLSWERFRCNTDCKNFPDTCISEKLYRDMADRIVADGYRELGYKYVCIDDCWLANERDNKTGKLQADPERFPNGIKALSDYVHSKGLKLGIYEDFGTYTCAGYPGSEFYMELDANTFAEWEVDLVKFDGCNSDSKDMDYGYPAMELFLNKTQRPILLSCEWPLYQGGHADYAAVRKTCNMWRTSRDMEDSWNIVYEVIDFFGTNPYNFSDFTGPGGWADPDVLIIGDFGLSHSQQKAQMAMWAMFSAPLFMSVDLRNFEPWAKSLLQNKNVIAINQDPRGIPAKRILEIQNSISVWIKPLAMEGSCAIAFLNNDIKGQPTRVETTLSQFQLNCTTGYNVTEVFNNELLGLYRPHDILTVDVYPTSVAFLKIIPLV